MAGRRKETAPARQPEEASASERTTDEFAAELEAETALLVAAQEPGSESPPAHEDRDDAFDPSAERDEVEVGAAAEIGQDELEREVAALLFVSSEPLSPARLAGLLPSCSRKRVDDALVGVSARLSASGLPFELRAIAGGWQLFTTPDMAETVAALSKAKKDEKISPAGLETLAIVAYRQPVTKAEVESIRGVQVGPILRTLVDRGLVRVVGRSDDPGHALLYGTTRQFLDAFALGSLEDLPRDGELLKD